jgi:hypothetical protein
MRLEVAEHLCRLGASRKGSSENFLGDLSESFVPLSIQRADDLVEAHEITDERQILAMACLVWICKCAGNDIAKLVDVAHVNAARGWIQRKSPA